jgi:uncharacterized protein (DUF2384 family)
MAATAIGHIYDKDHLHFFDESKQFNAKEVVDFLSLTKQEVSKLANVSKGSVRYDDRIPTDVRDRLLEIANICNLVADFFPGDMEKVRLWFITPNPQFGDVSPRDMIRHGRFKKLRNYIIEARQAQLG